MNHTFEFMFSYRYDTEWSANMPSAMGINHSSVYNSDEKHYYIGSLN